MRRTSFADWPCPVARTMDLLGDQWTMLVLRECFRGLTRFDEFAASLGIARTTLTERLDRLTGAGLLSRQRYQSRPPRYEYVLTESGRDFLPALAALMRWGEQWLMDGDPGTTVRHADCGRTAHGVVICSSCGEPLTNGTVRV
ncbi:winged helix-turn-helix transcriptional regulator [Labedaea rhizosphaerae]|uniref:HxlR family transcriptional regulator n=1 Tax=Labedaea rhizosphaerae TaxID=598644 RepID=A0A4R6SJW5_LABRH|nr:helix-turn-helix domain-containing protein [Labedaea rhizosphaerae]TDQ04636.1 HxlR family transcriptional regulator [Labedaea rhizosphaerae]